MATSSSSVGGVSVPPQTSSTGSAFGSTATVPTSPETFGGSTPGSDINIPGTKKSVLKLATNATKDANTYIVKPLTAANIKLLSEGQQGVVADWYRSGKPSTKNAGAFDKLPKLIQPFEEEIAAIRVFGIKNKKDQELLPAYTKFILESVQEGRSERSQIVETFGDFYVFLYGERPPTYTFTGTLINAKNHNWVSDFKFYYLNFLRGTKLVEQNARAIITYGGRMIEGFILGLNLATDAALEYGVKVSFPVVVTSDKFLGFSDDFGLITKGDKTDVDSKLKEFVDKVANADGAGTSAPATSAASQTVGNVMAGEPAAGVSGLA